MRRLLPLLLAVVFAVSCAEDQSSPTSPLSSGPEASILDGAHPPAEGEPWVPEFYWLPELVESPTIVGTFNPEVPARVKLCELPGTEASPPVGSVECVSGTEVTLFGPDAITASLDPAQYQVGWKTDDPIASPIEFLDPDKFYRMSVWVGTGENAFKLGHRDLDPEPSPPAGSNPKIELYYPFKLGNNISVKFWIGDGAFCEGSDPAFCGECFYTESGAQDGNSDTVGRACTAGERAGVYIPANPAIDGYLIVVERIPNDANGYTVADGRTLRCYRDPDAGDRVDFIPDLDLPQYGECFVITATCTLDSCVDLSTVDLSAIVGSCPVVPDNPDYHPVIHKTDNSLDPTVVEALDPADTFIPGEGDFLACSAQLSPVQAALSKIWRTLTPFDPEPAYASHRSLKGADAPSFSDFVWAIPSQQAKVLGDNQTGLAGTPLPDPLTVNVTDRVPSNFWDDDGSRTAESMDIEGADVTFTIDDASWASGGIGTLDGSGACVDVGLSQTITTGADGDASVCVVLPSESGTYNVDAGGYGIGEAGVAWTAAPGTGIGPYSHFALCQNGNTAPCVPLALTDLAANSYPPILLPPGNLTGLTDLRSDLVTFQVTSCVPGEGSATIDGELSPGEWDCSGPPVPFEANLGGGKNTGFLYRMQSDGNLYLGVLVPVDKNTSLKENTLTFYLNDNGAASLSDGDDVVGVNGVTNTFFDQHWTQGDCPKGQSFCAFDDPAGDPTGEGAMQLNYVDGNPDFYFYELRIPSWNPTTCPGSPYDICVDPTNPQLNAAFTFRWSGKGTKGNTEYPGPFGEYEQLIP